MDENSPFKSKETQETSTLKHQILEHLTKHSVLHLQPADHRFKGDAAEIDDAAQELDQSGHAVYTRTLDRLFLAENDKSEKAFKGGVYLEKTAVPEGAPAVQGVSDESAPKVDGVKPPVKAAKAVAKPSTKKK